MRQLDMQGFAFCVEENRFSAGRMPRSAYSLRFGMKENRLKPSVSGRSGQTLVEFALTLPLLALLLFGIIQYGFIFNAYMTLRHGMHVAARTESLPNITNSVSDLVCDSVKPMLDCTKLGTPTLTSNTDGTVSSVTVSGTYGLPLIVRFVVPGATGNTLTITASATYRKN